MCNNDRRNLRSDKRFHRLAGAGRSVLLALAAVAALAVSCVSARATDFVKPTDEELKMTSLPGYPGAPAVILFREEITRDDLHSVEEYDRIKILTEEGKKYANVELRFASTSGDYEWAGDDSMVEDISGRTIHPDGTVIPFTGKPYLKVIEKTNGLKLQEKVFTLPDVEVGSIIEYRYLLTYNDHVYVPPTWFVQDELYVKQAHFVWYPTSRSLQSEEEGSIHSISWFPVLPEGVKVDRFDVPGTTQSGPGQEYELKVKDVPPRVKEEYMPPIGNLSYSVHFSYTAARSEKEYWDNEGKHWSKRVNSFVGPNGALKEATQKIIEGATTPQEKLQKIYAAVMALDNTRFTRSHDKREDKAAGMGQVNNAADVLAHGRGTPTQLSELFIGMTRAAGFQAYAMLVPDRSEELFLPGWMSFEQFDDSVSDMVAIVVVDGKEQFFDPGSRYCPFGSLAWQHTYTQGLRQTDGGNTQIAQTTGEDFKVNRTTRVANLTMDEQGQITGKIDLTFYGAPALRWRQTALRGDDESLHKALQKNLEDMLPKTLKVEVSDIKDVTDYTKPLAVSYKVTGTMGNVMGKRMMLPSDVFLSSETAKFPHEKRETAVYFDYPLVMQDAIRVNFPSEFAVEAAPGAAKFSLPARAVYGMSVAVAPTNVTTRRDFVFGDVIVLQKDYSSLRNFYSQFESKDQESIVLKTAAANTASVTKPGGE